MVLLILSNNPPPPSWHSEQTLIILALALFALSQVSERISNFIKLYLPVSWIGNLRNRESNESKEKIRERKIMLISWIAGLITTLLFWNVVMDNWKQLSEQTESYKIPALILCSIFLSFGSKFWHDILDIIQQYKETKKSLNLLSADATTLNVIDEAFVKKRNEILSAPGVVSATKAKDHYGEPCIRVYFETRETAAAFDSPLPYTDAGGTEHMVPIEKIVSGATEAQAGRAGDTVFNASVPNRTGTLGYYLKDPRTDQAYILSCYHVMRANHNWYGFAIINKEDIYTKNGGSYNPIGYLDFGVLNDYLDVAIAKVSDQNLPVSQNSLLNLHTVSPVKENMEGSYVKIASPRGTIQAQIFEYNVPEVSFNFNDPYLTTHKLKNLFSLCIPGSDGLQRPTQPGDSGALVYTDKGLALGIIIGANDILSYAIRMNIITDSLGLEIM